MPASEPFASEETVEHALNCELLYRLPSFWKSLSSTKLTPTLSAIYSLTTSDRGEPLCGRLGKHASVREPIYK